MTVRITRATSALVLVLIASSFAFGAMRPWSLNKLTLRSEHVMVAQVKKLSEGYWGEWPGAGRVVFTDVTLEVQDVWKGTWKKDEITLQVPGGVLPDGRRMHASEAPRFEKDEKVLVFTKRYGDKWWVCGYGQGKYRVVKSRVEGQCHYSISKDILLHALKRRITNIVKEGK